LETAKNQELDGIVNIGGDDSNTTAAFLADYHLAQGSKTSVVGVPKTIDGDLMNRWIEQSFGFDSAAKTYSELAGNVAMDALSQGKYYFFIKVMGRTASHLVLETALNTRPNLALISEEIVHEKRTLDQVVAGLADLIVERSKKGLQHGVILIPEGLIECFPEFKTINPEAHAIWDRLPASTKEQLLMERDPHGNIPVSKIETERLLIHFVQQELAKRSDYKGSFQPQPLFFGYEGRCCYPTEFDASYCYALGITAAVLVKENKTGYMACIKHLLEPVEKWQGTGVPLIAMMNLEERKGVVKPVIRKGLVELDGDKFKQLKKNHETDALEDHYISTGPIQFS
ncbi:MAG: 6-phosphofructokinase, partial [Parachlamydiaceae bacterium]